jgi:hypothetical protein
LIALEERADKITREAAFSEYLTRVVDILTVDPSHHEDAKIAFFLEMFYQRASTCASYSAQRREDDFELAVHRFAKEMEKTELLQKLYPWIFKKRYHNFCKINSL